MHFRIYRCGFCALPKKIKWLCCGFLGKAGGTITKERFKMSDAFNEREKGFEAKYQHDQELEFKIIARRNKLFGLWVGEQIGLKGGDQEALARQVVQENLVEPGDGDIMRLVRSHITAAQATLSDETLSAELARLYAVAKEQLQNEG
jgi:hypothetical protein